LNVNVKTNLVTWQMQTIKHFWATL